MSVTYTAVLDVSEDSVLFLSGLLRAERIRRGTRTATRSLGTYKQAVLALRWLFDDTRISQLARDNGIGVSTAYADRDEAITVLAARKPSLRGALRGGASDDELAARWRTAMWGKRAGHGIDDPTFLQPVRPMSAIGG